MVCLSNTHRRQVLLQEEEPDSPAELEEDLLKDQNWTSAAQDGERLTSKHRVGHARHGRPEQRLYGTLSERERECEKRGFQSHRSVSSEFKPGLSLLLTMFPLVASPSRPPNVMTGDMQAQYRKRMDAKHCRLMASLKSLHRKGTFLRTSLTKPPNILTDRRQTLC